jgi:hypothetical protein
VQLDYYGYIKFFGGFVGKWVGAFTNLVSIVDEYPNLDLIGNARIDSVMYELAPACTGRRGRPAKHGKRLSIENDITLSNEKRVDTIQVSAGLSPEFSAAVKFLPMSLPPVKKMAQSVIVFQYHFSRRFAGSVCSWGRKCI